MARRCKDCLTVNPPRKRYCVACGSRKVAEEVNDDPRNCTRCGELLPADAFYFVSIKAGTRRGHCKACTLEMKAAQKDPNWLPSCCKCGKLRPRSGASGRRLCSECWESMYDTEGRRTDGKWLQALNPCNACGANRLRADHVKHSSLCPVCRSVPQHRRKRLKSYFNMNPREYVELLDEQGHACAICERSFGKTRPAHVDHRHADPPIIRGLVCGPCNTILGLAKDSAVRLRAAASFLDSPTAQRLFPGRVATEIGNRDSWETFRPLRRSA